MEQLQGETSFILWVLREDCLIRHRHTEVEPISKKILNEDLGKMKYLRKLTRPIQPNIDSIKKAVQNCSTPKCNGDCAYCKEDAKYLPLFAYIEDLEKQNQQLIEQFTFLTLVLLTPLNRHCFLLCRRWK